MKSGRPLAAAILTGGRASRMGGIRKATLRIGGTTIMDRQLDVLRGIAAPIFAVSSAAGEQEGGLEIVRDRFPDRGALGGIYTAIEASPHERVLVVGCDMPFLSGPLLTYMNGIDADIVVPKSARGYEPLCAIYSRACADAIRTRIERGQLEASVMPEGMRVVEVGSETLAEYDAHGLLFVNVNTPHDYERANTLLEGSNALRDRIMDELGP